MSSLYLQHGAQWMFRADTLHRLWIQIPVGPHGFRRKVTETMPVAQCSPPGQMTGLGLQELHRHNGFPLLYTEIFPGLAVCYKADFLFTQIEKIYMLHSVTQSWDGKNPAVPELTVNYLCHVNRSREAEPVPKAMGTTLLTILKWVFFRKWFQIQ